MHYWSRHNAPIVTKIVIIMMEIRSDPRFLISIFSPTITTAGTSTHSRNMWERTPQKTLDASQWLKRPLRLVRPGHDGDDCDDDHFVQDPWQQQCWWWWWWSLCPRRSLTTTMLILNTEGGRWPASSWSRSRPRAAITTVPTLGSRFTIIHISPSFLVNR